MYIHMYIYIHILYTYIYIYIYTYIYIYIYMYTHAYTQNMAPGLELCMSSMYNLILAFVISSLSFLYHVPSFYHKFIIICSALSSFGGQPPGTGNHIFTISHHWAALGGKGPGKGRARILEFREMRRASENFHVGIISSSCANRLAEKARERVLGNLKIAHRLVYDLAVK